MKTFRIAVAMMLLAAPAYAQSVNILPDSPSKTPDQIERDQQIERDYREGLKKIPDAKSSKDPWGGVRSADTPAKPAKPAMTKSAPKAPQKTSQAKPAASPQ